MELPLYFPINGVNCDLGHHFVRTLGPLPTISQFTFTQWRKHLIRIELNLRDEFPPLLLIVQFIVTMSIFVTHWTHYLCYDSTFPRSCPSRWRREDRESRETLPIMMKQSFLDFEKPIQELEQKIEELRLVQGDSAIDISEEIARLQKKSAELSRSIFAKLTPAQISQVSRHPNRPLFLDYVEGIFDEFEELHGDRAYADDKAIVGGVARFGSRSVVVVGQQKGKDTKDKIARNFGMPKPEGYRKALRLFKLAEKFGMPVLTFVDTPGAYPGIGAEERGQSEAIGRNLYELANLRTPVIVTVIGEGGSGGALALAVGDYVNMLEFATYSVISPEGCASILWKTAEKASDAAMALGITSRRLLQLKLIDRVIEEPQGGAHRNYPEAMKEVAKTLSEELEEVSKKDIDDLLKARFDKLMSYGEFQEK